MPSEQHRPADAGNSPAASAVQPVSSANSLENHLGGAEGRRYRAYQFDLVAPHVGRSLLEVGSGLGHFSEQFSGRLEYLIVSDNDPYCIGLTARHLASPPHSVSCCQPSLTPEAASPRSDASASPVRSALSCPINLSEGATPPRPSTAHTRSDRLSER
jgi:hypothetical protein